MTRLVSADTMRDQRSQMPVSRFLSTSECETLAKRAAAMAAGGGDTTISIQSTWTGNLRYARNNVTTTGDTRLNEVTAIRDIRGAWGMVDSTCIDDVGLGRWRRRGSWEKSLSDSHRLNIIHLY